MKKVLIISGHTDLNNSVANKTIIKELENKLSNVEVSYLDKLYPDYKINKRKEQTKLINADFIILQYPVFWYGMPSLLKKYLEEVLERGFSHGSNGDKLKGKKLIVSFTTGASEEKYHKDGVVGFEIEDFLPSVKATCNLCNLDFYGYIYTGGLSYTLRMDTESIDILKEKSIKHANKLIDLINK